MLAFLDHTWEQYGFLGSSVLSDEGIQNCMDHSSLRRQQYQSCQHFIHWSVRLVVPHDEPA